LAVRWKPDETDELWLATAIVLSLMASVTALLLVAFVIQGVIKLAG